MVCPATLLLNVTVPLTVPFVAPPALVFPLLSVKDQLKINSAMAGVTCPVIRIRANTAEHIIRDAVITRVLVITGLRLA